MAQRNPGKPGKQGDIRVGVGGWTFAPWRGPFYPDGLTQKRELEYASRHLTTIEINGTFYGAQKPESFARWRAETPDDFVFSVKASRYIVQKRALSQARESIDRFFNSGLAELREKLGPVLWQFAPTKKFDADDFAGFLALLPREVGGRPLRHALEPRHESFACPAFIDLARTHGAAVVTACDSSYPQIADQTGDFAYLRVMGTQESSAQGYDSAAVDAWTERARTLAAGRIPPDLRIVAPQAEKPKPRDVFFYFISGFKAHNPAAAMALIERLRQ